MEGVDQARRVLGKRWRGVGLAAKTDGVTSFHFFLAGEDRSHRDACAGLASLILHEAADWIDLAAWDACFLGRFPHERWYRLQSWRNDLQKMFPRLRLHGHVDGSPQGPDVACFRGLLLLASSGGKEWPDGIVIARDSDGVRDERSALSHASRATPPPRTTPVVLAVCIPTVEAWYLAGFQPGPAGEREALTRVTREISFDPTRTPERLLSHPPDHSRNAKRVMSALAGDAAERREACLADRARLRERGGGCGVAAYMDDVRRELVPLVSGGRPVDPR